MIYLRQLFTMRYSLLAICATFSILFTAVFYCFSSDDIIVDIANIRTVELKQGQVFSYSILFQAPWFSSPYATDVLIPKDCVLVDTVTVLFDRPGFGVSHYMLTVKYRPMINGQINQGAVTIHNPGTNSTKTIIVPGFKCVSLPESPMTDPKFMGPFKLHVRSSPFSYNGILVSIVTLICLVVIYYVYIRYYSPLRIILRRLNFLQKENMNGVAPTYHILSEVTDLIGDFLSYHLQRNMLSLTSTELVKLLKDEIVDIDYIQREELIEILQDLDVVIFASVPVASEVISQTLDNLRLWITRCNKEGS